jgi:hypothetical protein
MVEFMAQREEDEGGEGGKLLRLTTGQLRASCLDRYPIHALFLPNILGLFDCCADSRIWWHCPRAFLAVLLSRPSSN